MRKGIMSLLAVAVFVLAVHSLVLGAEPIKLKAANYLPVTHPMSLLTGWFCDEVKNRTKGAVEITYYPGGTVLNPVKMYDGVVTGIADIGVSHIQYTRGRFPVTEVFDLPLGFPSGWVDTQTVSDFYNKYKPKEWDNVHLLYINTCGPLVLLCNNKPVRTLEDLKGLKVRATGTLSEVIKALGALPIPLQMPDVYEALKRGVIDGVTVDLSTLKFWKFVEVVKYVTAMWRVGAGITFYCVMNKSKWNSIPPDVQKVITEVAVEAKDKQGALWDSMDIEARDLFLKEGGQVIPLSEAEASKWVKAVEPVIAAYKKDMVSKGYQEAEIDGWIKYIKTRVEYWRGEQKKRGLKSPF